MADRRRRNSSPPTSPPRAERGRHVDNEEPKPEFESGADPRKQRLTLDVDFLGEISPGEVGECPEI